MNYTNRNQNIDIYFAEIRKFDGLSREKEVELFERIRKGDKRAETEVFNGVAKLAVAIAKTYTSDADLLEDLIQEANLGILKAIPKFDLEKNIRFSTYAKWWMRMGISNYLNDMGVVHTKSPVIDDKVMKIRRDFFMKNFREPSEYEVMEILEGLGIDVKDVSRISELCVESIDDTDCDADESRVREFDVVTASVNDIIGMMDTEDNVRILNQKMSRLTEREQKIISMKYGLGGLEPMEYPDIAERLTIDGHKSISSERVRQIAVAALAKMKN